MKCTLVGDGMPGPAGRMQEPSQSISHDKDTTEAPLPPAAPCVIAGAGIADLLSQTAGSKHLAQGRAALWPSSHKRYWTGPSHTCCSLWLPCIKAQAVRQRP
jgi:hypothetical protein